MITSYDHDYLAELAEEIETWGNIKSPSLVYRLASTYKPSLDQTFRSLMYTVAVRQIADACIFSKAFQSLTASERAIIVEEFLRDMPLGPAIMTVDYGLTRIYREGLTRAHLSQVDGKQLYYNQVTRDYPSLRKAIEDLDNIHGFPNVIQILPKGVEVEVIHDEP